MSVGVPALLAGGAPTARLANYFIDDKTGAVYRWPLNHSTEDALKSLGRRLTRSGVSRKVRLMRQAAHQGPPRLVLHGYFLDRTQAQYAEFVSVFDNCDDRTFTYVDATGDSYRVIVIQFDARRKMAITRVDGSYFEYSLEVEVISVNQGALKGYVA